MRGPYLVAFLQASLAAATGYCPPLGPVFPAAKSLSTSASFKSDLEKLQATLQDAFSSGNTSYGPVNPNDTYSIQIFSARDARPLMDFSHRGTGVEDNKEVTGDSIFGIASTTKLITVYLLLLEAGDGIWAEKVTKYLPELASKGYWDDITVGALAGYVGGTVSEGEVAVETLILHYI
jgi:CubicO group peptidase (beta-lactamase class C family)